MKYKISNSVILLVVLASLLFVFVGCSDMMAKMGDVVLKIEAEDTVRTIVHEYTIDGILESSRVVIPKEIVKPGDDMVISNIALGKWTFTVVAFDDKGTEIGRGEKSIVLIEGQQMDLKVPVVFVPLPLAVTEPTFPAPSKVYDGNTSLAVTVGSLSGMVADDDNVSVEATATYNDKRVGSGKLVTVVHTLVYAADVAITGKYAPLADYTCNIGAITEKSLTISDPRFPDSKDKMYDGNNTLPVTAGSLIGVVDGDDVSVEAIATYADNKANSNKIITVSYTISGPDASNYIRPENDTSYTGNITKKPLTFTVAADEKIYDGDVRADGIISLIGVLTQDTVTADGTFTFSDRIVDSSKTVSVTDITLLGAQAGNYSLSTTTAETSASITKRTLKWDGTELTLSKPYDKNRSVKYTINQEVSGVVPDDGIVLSAKVFYQDSSIGGGKSILVAYTLEGDIAGNYITPKDFTAMGSITPIQLTVGSPIIENTSKQYDGTTGVSIAAGLPMGFLSGDSVAVTATAKYADKDVGTAKAITVSYALDATNNDAKNYLAPVEYTVNTGVITPVRLLMDAPSFPASTSKVYDGDDTVAFTIGNLRGVLGLDGITVVATARYADKNVGENKAITVSYTLDTANANAKNYLTPVAYTVDTGAITKKQLTISPASFPNTPDKAYDGNASVAVTKGTLDGVIPGEFITAHATARYADQNIGDAKPITVTYSIEGTNIGNYSVPVADTTRYKGAIVKARLVLLDPVIEKAKAYDHSDSCVATPGMIVFGKVGSDDVQVAIDTATYDDMDVGDNKTITVVYRLTGLDAGKYTKPADHILTNGKIEKKQLVLSTSPLPTLSREYDGTDRVAFTGGVVAGVYEDDAVTISEEGYYQETGVGTGKGISFAYAVSGTHAKNYLAPPVYTVRNGAITRKALTVATNGTAVKAKTYDGTASARITSHGALEPGVISGEAVTLEATASYESSGASAAGTTKDITVRYALRGLDAGNYYITSPTSTLGGGTIQAKPLGAGTPNFTASTSKAYDGEKTLPVTAGALIGVLDSDVVTLSATASYESAEAMLGNKITVKYALAGDAAANYVVPADYRFLTGSITARQLTIGNLPIEDTKTYDGDDSLITTAVIPIGFVGDDRVIVTATATYADKNVGTAKAITVSYVLDSSNAKATNYLAPAGYTVRTGVITKKSLTVAHNSTQMDPTKVYDGSPVARVTNSGTLGEELYSGDVVVLGAKALYDDKTVGTGKRVSVEYFLTGTDAGNYETPASNSTTYTCAITTKPLTVIAGTTLLKAEKPYDGTAWAEVIARGVLFGIVANDDVNLATAATFQGDKNVGYAKVITAVYTLGGTDAANYSKPEDYSISTGRITPKQLTIGNPSILVTSKLYDRNTNVSVTAGEPSGFQGSDSVAVTATAKYADKDVGTAKAITVSYALDATNNDAKNYLAPVDYTVNTGTITPLRLIIGNPIFSGTLDKVYDGTDTTAFGLSKAALQNAIAGDDIAVDAIATYSDKNVGTDKGITVSYALDTANANAKNYLTPVAYTVDTGAITKKQLTISPASFPNTPDKAYDGNASVAVTKGTLDGVIPGEFITAHATARYADQNIGDAKPITVTYTIEGTNIGNYSVPVADTTRYKGAIVKARLVLLDPVIEKAKAYDHSTSCVATPGMIVFGKVGSDDVQVAIDTATYDDMDVGDNKTITVVYRLTGLDAGKYTKPADHILTNGKIEKKQLVLSTSPLPTLSREYDGTDRVAFTGGVVAGVYEDDAVTISEEGYYQETGVGTGKGISFAYAVSGTHAKNYLAPPVYTVRNGAITRKALTVATNGTAVKAKTYDGTASARITSHGALEPGVISGEAVTLEATASYESSGASPVGTTKDITVRYALRGLDAGNYYITSPTSTLGGGTIQAKPLGAGTPNFTASTSKAYDGEKTLPVTAGALIGVLDSDVVTLSATASYESAEAMLGNKITVKYALAGDAAANYVVPADYRFLTGSITARQLTIGNLPIEDTKTYDGDDSLITTAVTPIGFVGDDRVIVTATATYADKNVGTAKAITVSYVLDSSNAKATNYLAPAGYTVRTGVITAKKLTISAPTFISMNKTYDGGTSLPVTAGTLSGFFGSDTVVAEAAAKYANKNVGSSTITVSYALRGPDAGNYIEPNTVFCEGMITPRQLTISEPTVFSKQYNGNRDITFTLGTLNGVYGRDDVQIDEEKIEGYYDNKEVGSNKHAYFTYDLKGDDASNYIRPGIDFIRTGEITRKVLSVTGTQPIGKIYDRKYSALVDTSNSILSPGVAGEIVELDTKNITAFYSTVGVGSNKSISISYPLQGRDAANYVVWDDTSKTSNITKKPLTVTGTSILPNKIYNGTTAATVNDYGTLHGIVDDDNVSLSSVTATYPNEFASDDAKVITVKYTIDGSDETNYSKPGNNTTNYSGFISKATYNMDEIKFAGASCTYDGNAHSIWISGTPHTDVRVSYSNNGKMDAAEHEVIASFSGDSNNYHVIPSKTAILNIQQKEVTVTAHVNDKTYDGKTTADGGLSIVTGRIGSDNVNATGAFSFADANASSTSKTVNVREIHLNGPKAGNYKVAPEASTTAMISKKQLTISGTDIWTSKVADGTTTADVIFDGTLDGVIPGDGVSVFATATYDSENVGINKTITVCYELGGTQADNYLKPKDSTFIGIIESPGELKIILTWGETPRDLDFYLKTPDGTVVYYGNKNHEGDASLTTDATNGYGPETLNIDPIQNGRYSCYVKNHSGNYFTHPGAKIEVYYNSVLVKTYLNPISSEGNFWNVFTYTNRTFTDINQIVSSAPWT